MHFDQPPKRLQVVRGLFFVQAAVGIFFCGYLVVQAVIQDGASPSGGFAAVFLIGLAVLTLAASALIVGIGRSMGWLPKPTWVWVLLIEVVPAIVGVGTYPSQLQPSHTTNVFTGAVTTINYPPPPLVNYIPQSLLIGSSVVIVLLLLTLVRSSQMPGARP